MPAPGTRSWMSALAAFTLADATSRSTKPPSSLVSMPSSEHAKEVTPGAQQARKATPRKSAWRLRYSASSEHKRVTRSVSCASWGEFSRVMVRSGRASGRRSRHMSGSSFAGTGSFVSTGAGVQRPRFLAPSYRGSESMFITRDNFGFLCTSGSRCWFLRVISFVFWLK